MVGVLVAAGAGALARAASKPFWSDELFTLYLSQLPDLGVLWAALAAPTDVSPPLTHVAMRAVNALLGAGLVTSRLPATFGFLVAAACVFRFLRVTAGWQAGLAGMSFFILSGAFPYAYEARPYGLLLGFTGLALVFWQGAARNVRRAPLLAGLFLSLLASFSTHYYAPLILAPLAAGEAVRAVTRRRADWWMWAAMTTPLFVIVAWFPLIQAARTYTATYFAVPALPQAVEAYRNLVEPAALSAFGAIVFAALVAAWSNTRAAGHAAGHERGTATVHERGSASAQARRNRCEAGRLSQIHEVAASLVLAALPLFAYAAGALVTGVFVSRYALPAAMGLALLAGLATCQLTLGRPMVAAALALALALAAAGRQSVPVAKWIVRGPSPEPTADLSGATSDLPVVISHALVFLPAWHEASPDLRARLVYLLKPERLIRRGQSDTGGRNLKDLSPFVPIEVVPFDDFVGANRDFYLYGPPTWMTDLLIEEGAHLSALSYAENSSLFLVRTEKD